ncbi:2-dehydro-3-deoxy-6-phosphogalactonate aldolase [Altererythrobacter sp.]|uniref:2-dehydro-3-deoxy-6-phosphogalactonate aldolase n=1 Tax=Altererythrobacter sp. TaxID=1872480 RepID=UPI003D060094
MSALDFDTAFEACPLVAILRGLTPPEAADIGLALVEAGFTLIEVPLNSPEPLSSIGIMQERFGDRAMVGAGTVLSPHDAEAVAGVGGRFVVSPNTHAPTIERTRELGMASLPGYYTVSEAFTALDAGATALKLFPADCTPPAMLKAQRAVLPKDTRVLAVGGINKDNMAEWTAAGADGFGLGSILYKPGKTAESVAADARALLSAIGKA